MFIKRKTYNELIKMAYCDVMTGLYNRNWFHKHYIETLQKTTLNLAVTDVNNLKKINDKYGHFEGDKYINKIGKELSRFGTAIRYGGDEFFIIVDNDKKDDFVNYCDSQNNFAYAYEFGFNGEDVVDVIDNLDKKMYECKYKQKRVKID